MDVDDDDIPLEVDSVDVNDSVYDEIEVVEEMSDSADSDPCLMLEVGLW